MIRRIFPHPYLSLTLALVWLALVNKVTPGNVFLGLVFGVALPFLTQPYWPNRPKVGRPLRMIEYALVVLWDIVLANVEVALVILFKRNDAIQSHWIAVPLDLRSPEAITVLAGTITMTPGTVTSVLAADGRALLVHCLDTGDPDGIRQQIKERYEYRLKEIFE